MEDPHEQRGIKRICELYDQDVLVTQIGRALEEEGIPSRRAKWNRQLVCRILERAGYKEPRERKRKSLPSRRERDQALDLTIRDKKISALRAAQLRAEGLSLRKIAARLLAERHLPPRSNSRLQPNYRKYRLLDAALTSEQPCLPVIACDAACGEGMHEATGARKHLRTGAPGWVRLISERAKAASLVSEVRLASGPERRGHFPI